MKDFTKLLYVILAQSQDLTSVQLQAQARVVLYLRNVVIVLHVTFSVALEHEDVY